MKKMLFSTGAALVLINLAVGLIFDGYLIFNSILVTLSITSSIIIVYLLLSSDIADGFRIALTFGYMMSGLCKIIFSLLSKTQIENNILILAILIIIVSEYLLFQLSQYMTKHVS